MNEIARNKIKELFCSECAFLNKCAADTDGCHVYSKAVELYKWTKEQTVSEAGRWFMEHAEDFIDGAQWADDNPTTPSIKTILEILRINSNIHDRSNPHWIAEQIFKQLNKKNDYDTKTN